MKQELDTIIVGGGIAGLACARSLMDRGRRFMLLSDRLGGRMHVAHDGNPFGAAYVTTDYHNVLRYADRRERISLRDCCFWDGERFITVFDPRNIGRVRALARVYRLVIRLRERLNDLRRQVPRACQKELLEADELLSALVRQPATELVRENGLEEITEIYCGPMFLSTLFVDWREANAFYYLANLFPIWLRCYTAHRVPVVGRLTRGYRERIEQVKVQGVEPEGDRFRVHADSREYVARHLVLALPDRNLRALGPIGESLAEEHPVRDIPFSTVHVRGVRRPAFKPGRIVFLRGDEAVRVLWPQRNGVEIVFCPGVEPDLDRYYEDPQIEGAVCWRTAIQMSNEKWRPLEPKPNLFTIGDHNICGLEDSFLTGVHAATRIAERSPRAW